MIEYASSGTSTNSSVLTAKDVTKITEKFFKVPNSPFILLLLNVILFLKNCQIKRHGVGIERHRERLYPAHDGAERHHGQPLERPAVGRKLPAGRRRSRIFQVAV